MTRRVQYLQLVMSGFIGSSSYFPGDLLLTGTANYFQWHKILKDVCDEISPDLIPYLENGEISFIEGEDDATRKDAMRLLDRIINLILRDAASGYVLRDVNRFNGTGRELYLYLRSIYGVITVPFAISIMYDLLTGVWKQNEGSTIDSLENAYDRVMINVAQRFSFETYNVIVYLAILKKEGLPVDEYIRAYHDVYGTGWEDFTLTNMQRIIHERMDFPTQSIPVNPKTFVSKKVFKCFRCGEPGHLDRNCPAPQPLSHLKS